MQSRNPATDWHARLQIICLTAASVVLLVVAISTSKSLYFVWEEWGILWNAVEGPFWGLMQSHFGYVIPLARLLFLLEVQAFADWYTGYVLVNVTLMIAIVFLMWRTLRPRNIWASWGLVGGLITLLLSGGSLHAVHFAAMSSYFLCWLFGILALYFWRQRKGSPYVVLCFLGASASNSLMNVVVASFVISVMIGLDRFGCDPQWSWSRVRGPVGYAILAGSLSLVLYLVGQSFPSVDPLVGVQQTLVPSSSSDILSSLIPFAALLSIWLVTPFLGVLALNQDLYQRAVILFIDTPILSIFLITVITTALLAVLSRRQGGIGLRHGSLALVLLASAIGFAIQLVMFRGNQGYEVRYTLMWLPSIVVFWSRLIDLSQVTTLRWLARVGAISMVLSGLVVTALAPFWVSQAVDLVRPRTTLSLQLKQDFEKCGGHREPLVADVLIPGMPWEEICDAAHLLRNR